MRVRGGRRGRASSSTRGRGRRGRSRGGDTRAGTLSDFEVEDLAAPEGWAPPTITPNCRSPIVLRRRPGGSQVSGPGHPPSASEPRSPPPRSPSPPPLPQPFCPFSTLDFYPGATFSPAKVVSRQSTGEYCSWLHNCGEPWCPFGEIASSVVDELRNEGLAYEPGVGRTLSEAPVDHRAFLEPVYVQVGLELLGYDPTN